MWTKLSSSQTHFHFYQIFHDKSKVPINKSFLWTNYQTSLFQFADVVNQLEQRRSEREIEANKQQWLGYASLYFRSIVGIFDILLRFGYLDLII